MGIVRRIEDLGRVVISKEICRTIRERETNINTVGHVLLAMMDWGKRMAKMIGTYDTKNYVDDQKGSLLSSI